MRYDFSSKKRIIIKVGSSLIVDDYDLRKNWFNYFAHDIAELINNNHHIIIVSSGAIALGIKQISTENNIINKKNLNLVQKQAMSAIGQIFLMNNYHHIFQNHSLNVAQILLTAEDCNVNHRRENFKNTIEELLSRNIIPIINENDSIAVDEIKIGDNDTLAAHIAKITDANLMILFSDIDGLYEENPKLNQSAKFIDKVNQVDEKILKMASDSISNIGTGGMITKIKSAKMLQCTGCDTIITSGVEDGCLSSLIANQKKFTLFTS